MPTLKILLCPAAKIINNHTAFALAPSEIPNVDENDDVKCCLNSPSDQQQVVDDNPISILQSSSDSASSPVSQQHQQTHATSPTTNCVQPSLFSAHDVDNEGEQAEEVKGQLCSSETCQEFERHILDNVSRG